MTQIFTFKSATGSVEQFVLCRLHGDLIAEDFYSEHLRHEGQFDLADEWRIEMD